MPGGIENQISWRLSRHIESVPAGTDSSFNNGRGRGWIPELEGREPFPRDDNGLVDVRQVYDQYLIDRPDTIPTQVTYEMRDEWIHQHLYFWRLFYLQKDTPPILRDEALIAFRKAVYNQLIMRPEEELKVHQRYGRMVSPPPPETMKNQLVDFNHLDHLGAAAIGRRVALVPEALEFLSPGTGPSKIRHQYSPTEVARFYDREMERRIEILKNPLVTDQRVITGAISRMARMINNERLREETERRINIDPVYYPVRVKKLGTLLDLSNSMLKDIAVVYLPEVNSTDLQTEADVIELHA